MSLDPRIGKLNSGKFYCFPDGNGKPEFVGTLEQVEAALGICRTPVKTVSASSKPVKIRTYQVVVTPRMVTYAGHSTYGEYTVEVDATSHSAAITKVRQERNANEGSYGVRATYKAKVISP